MIAIRRFQRYCVPCFLLTFMPAKRLPRKLPKATEKVFESKIFVDQGDLEISVTVHEPTNPKYYDRFLSVDRGEGSTVICNCKGTAKDVRDCFMSVFPTPSKMKGGDTLGVLDVSQETVSDLESAMRMCATNGMDGLHSLFAPNKKPQKD